MKQVLVLITALLYLFTSTGLTVALHFCGGSLADVAVNEQINGCGTQTNSSGCSTFSTDTGSCCKTVLKKLALDDDQLVKSNGLPDYFPTISAINSGMESDTYLPSSNLAKPVTRPPPEKTPLFILHTSLIFYA